MWASGAKAVGVVVPTSSLYVERTGAAGYDFATGDFTKDNAWHELDIDSIVPAGATIAHWHIRIYRAGTAGSIQWRAKGQAVDGRIVKTVCQTINTDWPSQFWLDVGDDRKIEYQLNTGTWQNVDLVCLGSFIEVS